MTDKTIDEKLVDIIKTVHADAGETLTKEEVDIWHDAILAATDEVVDAFVHEIRYREALMETIREEAGTYYDSEIGETRVNGYGNEEYCDALQAEIDSLEAKVKTLRGE